ENYSRHIKGALKAGDFHECLQTGNRIGIQFIGAEVGEDTVFIANGHDIRSNTHSHQVEVVEHLLFGSVSPGTRLDQLKASSTSAKLLESVRASMLFGIKYCRRRGHCRTEQVVITDNEIHIVIAGKLHHFKGLDSAGEGDDKRKVV